MNLKVSQLVLMISGAFAFLFSFFFAKGVEAGGFNSSGGYSVKETTITAWSTDANLLFIATWPAIFGLIIAGVVAAKAFANVEIPEVLTMKFEQIAFVLSVAGLLTMFGFLIADGDKAWGFWLMLLGCIGLVAGTVMELLGIDIPLGGGSGGGASGFGGQQGGYPPQGPGGYPQQGDYPPQGPGGYPPQGPPQGGGYPPQGPPQGGGYPPQGPPQGGF